MFFNTSAVFERSFFLLPHSTSRRAGGVHFVVLPVEGHSRSPRPVPFAPNVFFFFFLGFQTDTFFFIFVQLLFPLGFHFTLNYDGVCRPGRVVH